MTSSRDSTALHPAIGRALAAYPAAVARRAAAGLGSILSARIAADAWTASRLTGDGFPFELAFASHDERLRYTADASAPDVAAGDRLDEAAAQVERLGSTPIPRGLLRAFRRAQAGGKPAFGAWIGGRHGPDGDEYKLYVEIPAAPGAATIAAAHDFGFTSPRVSDRDVTLRMIAYSPAPRRLEAYFRVASVPPHHLPRLLAPGGLEARSDAALRWLTDSYGYSLRGRLPGEAIGVSYVRREAEPPSVTTLFFKARSFWGSDAAIRRGFCRATGIAESGDGAYQAASAPVATRESWKTCHGLVGFALAPDGPSAVSIGLRPWLPS